MNILNTNSLLSKDTSSMSQDLERLIMYSGTQQTWARHCSAWNSYNAFCSSMSISNSLPVDLGTARAFATWAISKKGLKSSTVKAYLGSIHVAHVISNTPGGNFNSDRCIKMALKGAKNLESIGESCKIDRLPMSYDLLSILGHRLNELNWSNYSKQIFWTAATISFFTSCRMGEILPSFEKGFDPNTTLLWQNVKFLNGKEAIMFIPYCKVKGFNGKIIDIFPIKNDAKCPAAALSKLKKLAMENDMFNPSLPVFALRSGKNFTKEMLNKGLSHLLDDFCDEFHKITGHSFRAGIPTFISSHPDKDSISELKEWGNWQSNSYKVYEKDEREKRRKLFMKIIENMYMCKTSVE